MVGSFPLLMKEIKCKRSQKSWPVCNRSRKWTVLCSPPKILPTFSINLKLKVVITSILAKREKGVAQWCAKIFTKKWLIRDDLLQNFWTTFFRSKHTCFYTKNMKDKTRIKKNESLFLGHRNKRNRQPACIISAKINWNISQTFGRIVFLLFFIYDDH